MTSTSTVRVGCQIPTYRFELPYSESKAEGCIKFAAVRMRLQLDEWQKGFLRGALAVRINERGECVYVHTRIGLEVPRQNGKTAVIVARICWGAVVMGEKILYTAHDGSTVEKMLDTLKEYFGEKRNDPDCKFPWLNSKLLKFRAKNGKEAFFFKNGGAIYLSTRTKSAKRGYTVDLVIIDEGQELQESQAKALTPTLTSAPLRNPQTYIIGTPPGPDCLGDNFSQLRSDVRSGSDRHSIMWWEWAVEDVGNVYDVDRMYRTNPALGIRITVDSILLVMGTFRDDVSRAQECLGYFLPRSSVDTVIGTEEWAFCEIPAELAPKGGEEGRRPPEGTAVCYGVKLAPDDSVGSLAVCIRERGGKPHVELLFSFSLDNGITWLTDWIIARKHVCASVAIDGKGTAQALAKRLDEGGFPRFKKLAPGYADAAAAYSMMRNAVRDGEMTHLADDALAVSATKSARRKIGSAGGYGFASTNEADSTPIEACSLALWALSATKVNPNMETGLAIL